MTPTHILSCEGGVNVPRLSHAIFHVHSRDRALDEARKVVKYLAAHGYHRFRLFEGTENCIAELVVDVPAPIVTVKETTK